MIVNQVILIGNLGCDPEIRVLETGVRMARFRLATTERFARSDGEMIAHTEWHDVVLWREAARYAEQNLRTGSYVRVEGRLRSREKSDPLTHTSQRVYEIVADKVQLLSNDAVTTVAEKKSPSEPPRPSLKDVDNLPF